MNSSIRNRANPAPPPSGNGTAADTPPRSDDQPRQSGAPTSADLAPAQWGHAKRILFRFAFAYLLLFWLPFVLAVPARLVSGWPEILHQPYAEASRAVVSWAAEQVLQLELKPRPGGNGDMTEDYVRKLCQLALAAAAAAVWSLLDRRRHNDARLLAWLRVGVAFCLAATMVQYGVVKVFPSQFGRLSPELLTTTVGQMDRMLLLWTFMAASPAYTIFTGVAELLGGLLLTCRRTRLLGALVCAGVMANVVMLNFSYNVTVKLFSSHLLAMCFFVAAADLRRLVDFFVLGRAARPAAHYPLFAGKTLRWTAQTLMTVLVLGYVALSLREGYTLSRTFGVLAPKPPLDGVWYVKEVVADGVVQPATDPTCWKRVIFDPGVPGFSPATLRVTRRDDSREWYVLELDTDRRIAVLSHYYDPSRKATLTYNEPAPQTLVLQGALDGRQVRITFHGVDESQFPINQPIRWITG
jgi:hypothetical protein